MDTRQLGAAAITAAAFLLLTACSEAPKTEAKPEAKEETAGPAKPITAKTAFWAMYKPAFKWAKDAEPLSMTAKNTADIKFANGLAGEWTAIFVSPSLKEARTLTYAVAGEHKGSAISGAQPWYGGVAKSKPFLTGVFVVDSDAAFKTAADKAHEWLTKNADKKVEMYLGSENRFANPVWYVIWGDPAKAGYVAFVDATTGLSLNK
jgi:hypothetical protein